MTSCSHSFKRKTTIYSPLPDIHIYIYNSNPYMILYLISPFVEGCFCDFLATLVLKQPLSKHWECRRVQKGGFVWVLYNYRDMKSQRTLSRISYPIIISSDSSRLLKPLSSYYLITDHIDQPSLGDVVNVCQVNPNFREFS